ncbi:unnamed protein product, partial [Polarella glacialis]
EWRAGSGKTRPADSPGAEEEGAGVWGFWSAGDSPASSSSPSAAMPHPGIMQVVVDRTEGQVFRERVGFLVLCIIGAYCLMRILIELRSILEPFLWALFLVMA